MEFIRNLRDKIQGKIPEGKKRSPRWAGVRKAHLARFPTCALCGGARNLEVHHIFPFHLKPELELDPTNLITLCEAGNFGIKSCHRAIGHFGDWHRINLHVVRDAAYWNKKLKTRK
jgi:hypothetical protein